VPYRFGDSIVALHDDGRRVRVGFEHGGEEDFDIVVAADGLRSSTRDIAMPGQADTRFLGLCMAYFTIPREDTDTDLVALVRGRERAHRHPAAGPARHHAGHAVDVVPVRRARSAEPGCAEGAAAGGLRRRRLGGRAGARRDGPDVRDLLRSHQPVGFQKSVCACDLRDWRSTLQA
jgi:2-polyprenyl-6-methoxyphenol hydroxylase-like FAD-dependent oxidoreductase